jgi:hypothetical protein
MRQRRDIDADPVLQSRFTQGTACPTASGGTTRGIWTVGTWPVPGGHVAHWEVDAPPNVLIVQAHVPEMADNDGSYSWGQYFYWDSGNSGWSTNLNDGAGSWPSPSGWQTFSPSRYFGWELSCNAASQCGQTSAYFDVFDLQLEAYEYQTPSIIAGPISGGHNLWYQAGKWVHGSLPVDIAAADPSGVCRALVSWDGQTVQDTGERPPNSAYWDPCDPNHASNTPQVFFGGATVNTATAVPASATGVPLVLMAHNASENLSTGQPDWSSYAESLNVDNLPVGVSLNGPKDVPVTAGTQDVTATASSGPSGVGSIMCSVDGSPPTPERISGAGAQTATAQVAVSGLGVHTISCYAANRAVDGNGAPTTSPTQTWSLKIGEPVQIYAGLRKVVRECRRVRDRSRKRVKRVRRCGPRARDRVVEQVRFGRRVSVSGWIATAAGAPLAQVPVSIMTAPVGDFYTWHQATVVTTAKDGHWSVTLPPGPSRLIQVVYPGGPVTEAATSPTDKATVPAKIVLARLPTHVPWGGVLVIRGRVLGGWIPPEQILQMRSGVGRRLQVIGNPYIRAKGRFVVRLAATGSGGPLHTQIAVATLRETNNPYARGVSRRVRVTIG